MGEIPGICIRQKWQCSVKQMGLMGKMALVLPTDCPGSVGLLAGNLLAGKPKSPLFPGAGDVVTSDWCIIWSTETIIDQSHRLIIISSPQQRPTW